MVQAVLGPSDVFGELSVFDPGPRTSTASALTEVRAVSMHRFELRGWMAAYPDIAEQLLRVLARRVRRTTDTHAELMVSDVPARVAKQLLRLAQRFGTQDDGALRVSHDLTREEIAQLVASSRQAVDRVLTDFARRGWIRLDGPSVLILDSARLSRRASSGCAAGGAGAAGGARNDAVTRVSLQ